MAVNGINWKGYDVTKAPVIGIIITKPIKLFSEEGDIIHVYDSQKYEIVDIIENGRIYVTNQWNKFNVPQIVHVNDVEQFIPIEKQNENKREPMKAKKVGEVINEDYSQKDIDRIENIINRSKNDEGAIKLANAMAKSITDQDKAMSRAEAAWKVLGKNNNKIADVFLARVKELGGNPIVSSDRQSNILNIPTKNEHVGNKGIIFLPTYSAIALWDWEITGQLSDGAWENARPDDHWRFWHNLDVKFGKPEVWRNNSWPKKTGYGLNSLIEYVGDRMVIYGKFGKAVGSDILNMGGEVRSTIEDLPTKGPVNLSEFHEEEIIKHAWRAEAYYWKGLKQKHIDAFYSTQYTEKDMRKDLAIIKSAMKNITI